jgi:homopolymeric O-antigen transport system ATP-binding protein
MINDIAISVKNITKTYKLYDTHADRVKEAFHPLRKKYHNPFNALTDVSFDVIKGETLGIIGRNGSGKSTLLQIICGILHPSSGNVEVDGKVSALLELGAGFNPEFTGRQNVYINGSILGLTHEEIENRFDEIAAFADIGKYIDQPVKTYSSGMSIRLAFAVIAHVDADILIIDEALAVGDVFFVQKCMRFLRKFMEHGTVLFVSHDTGAVINLCNRAVWLQKGVAKLMGPPKEISEAYLAALYEEQQSQSAVRLDNDSDLMESNEADYKDMRLDYINTTNLRNDIELFEFQTDAASFGDKWATIVSVTMVDKNGTPLSWVVGGENISLVIECRAHTELFRPIIGFFIKDRLGQTLFGDNTFITYQSKPVSVASGQIFQAQFSFRMPLLPIGGYSIAVAVAEGTQKNHFQHHWVHDAVVFKSHSSVICHGLIGISMKNIKMSVSEK